MTSLHKRVQETTTFMSLPTLSLTILHTRKEVKIVSKLDILLSYQILILTYI